MDAVPAPDDNEHRPLDGESSYADVATAHELERFASAAPQDCRQQLEKSAFRLGQFIGAGVVDRADAEPRLLNVAQSINCGDERPTDGEIEAIVQSGIEAGIRSPRFPPELESLLNELAELSPAAFGLRRKSEADRIGIPVTMLDREMEMRRQRHRTEPDVGRGLDLNEPDPWPEPVDGANLLDMLVEVICRHLILPESGAVAIALWVPFTHTFDAWDTSPYLGITSPTLRCGKTTAFSILDRVVKRALPTSNVTSAVVYRVIERFQPTLLMDEMDTYLPGKNELKGILNSGHTKATAYVLRCSGEDHEPERFSTWTPVAFAKIGKLPATLHDRSIEVRMRRRRPDEKVERFRANQTGGLDELARKSARWAKDNIGSLRSADPRIGVFSRRHP